MNPTSDRFPPRSGPILVLAALLAVAAATWMGLGQLADGNPVERIAGWAGAVATTLVLALPGLLALLAGGDRRVLLAGGALGVFIGVTGAFSLGPLILLLPSAVFVAAAVRGPVARSGGWAAALVPVAFGLAALFLLHARADPICWALVGGTGGPRYVRIPPEGLVAEAEIAVSSGQLPPGAVSSGCATDHVTAQEGLLSGGSAVLALGTGWALSERRPGGPRPSGTHPPETPRGRGGAATRRRSG